MNIIAITPFTGSERLVAMTEDCITQLLACDLPPGATLRIVAVNNNAARGLRPAIADHEMVEQLPDTENYGFGVGVNRGIDLALIGERWPCDQILVFNNDLQFHRKDWLVELLKEVEGRYVLSPRTDVTATVEACHPGPDDLPARRVGEVSAFCWLVPRKVIEAIEVRYGFPLFHPQFSNYGSDDMAAAILRGLYGATPFKVVHRSWVKHLKAQTANELHVKAGTKELLTELQKCKRANGLK